MPFGKLLEQLRDQKALIDFRRDDYNCDDLRGLVLGVSESLVLLGVVGDRIQHEGYCLINHGDITFLRWDTDVLRGWKRVVGEVDPNDPIPRTIDLADWAAALRTVIGLSVPCSFHREGIDSRTCYIARKVQIMESLIVGDQITTEGEEDGRFALRISDLTRLDFGGGYEKGLLRMLETA